MSGEGRLLPSGRNWRDIPQQVKPRAMSPEGRRRLAMRIVGVAGAFTACGALGWCAWQVAAVMRDDPKAVTSPEAASPVGGHVSLATDGVLTQAWLLRTLALPKRATLDDIDLGRLRERILGDGQASQADITKIYPAALAVHLSERTPVARVMAQSADGSKRELLAARDGVVYPGFGYDPAMIATLPWLSGIRLTPRGAGFEPIDGMEVAADLLAHAKLEAGGIYGTWEIVSLARLRSDALIEVVTRNGLKVVFSASDSFFGQLAKLDVILDSATKARPGQLLAGTIDLSLGAQVPVKLTASDEEPAPAATLPLQNPLANFRIRLN